MMKVLMHILILTLFIEERAYYHTACMEYSSFLWDIQFSNLK